MPKYKENEKVTLKKSDYLHNHPELFAVLVWEYGECDIVIFGVSKETYIFFHGTHIIEVHHSYLDDPINCKVTSFIYDHKKVRYSYNKSLGELLQV